jgi:hypothetical protein
VTAFDPSTPVRKLKPGLAGYWIGGLLIVFGIVGAIVWFAVGLIGISNSVDDFARVPADGGGTVTLDGDEPYVVYIEEDSSTGIPGDVRVSLTDPSGEPVELRNYSTDFTYDFGGRSGTAQLTFRSDAAGDYALASTSSSSQTTVAVGPSLARNLVWSITMPFVIGGIGLLVGVILIIVTLVRRSGDKKRRDAPGTRTTPPPHGFPPPGFPQAR